MVTPCSQLSGEFCSLGRVLVTPAGCAHCQTEWRKGEPTEANLTPFLVCLRDMPPHEPETTTPEYIAYHAAMRAAGLPGGCTGC